MGRLKETRVTLDLLAATAKRIFATYATRPHRTGAESGNHGVCRQEG